MPEIHIPAEAVSPEVDEKLLAARELEELAKRTAWDLWLGDQGAKIQALAAEWSALRGTTFELSTKHDRRGRVVFVCESRFGYHESHQSHEHALFLMVDAHRTRLEDRPETAARIAATEGGSLKSAQRRAQAIAKQVREAHPYMPGEERDGLVEKAVEELERKRGKP